MAASTAQSYPFKVVWGEGVEWLGHLEGEGPGQTFVVEDVKDQGVSERLITGAPPRLKPIPVQAIHDKGGRVLPYGSPD